MPIKKDSQQSEFDSKRKLKIRIQNEVQTSGSKSTLYFSSPQNSLSLRGCESNVLSFLTL
jgi:hypothetical protein